MDGCRIHGKHPLDHFDGLIGWDTVHPHNSRVREALDHKQLGAHGGIGRGIFRLGGQGVLAAS